MAEDVIISRKHRTIDVADEFTTASIHKNMDVAEYVITARLHKKDLRLKTSLTQIINVVEDVITSLGYGCIPYRPYHGLLLACTKRGCR